MRLPWACPAGSAAGQQVDCDCADAGSDGVAICQDDGTLSVCDCSGGSSGSGGMSGTTGGSGGGAGNNTGTGGGGGATGGAGGAGGTTPDDDGGVVEPDPDASVPVSPLPDDGEQGSVCDDGVDCNQGFDCYNAGVTGQGFCSAACTDNNDCEAIAGATYTCSMSTSVCIVECEGEADTESCPDQMVCVSTAAGFPGGGGGAATFRCKYPDAAPTSGTQTAYEPCNDGMPCEDGLVCNSSGMGGGGGDGYCSIACTVAMGGGGGGNACADISAPSGEIEPTCTMAFGGPGAGIAGRCTLDCSDSPDGCPDGMTCIDNTVFQRCGYE